MNKAGYSVIMDSPIGKLGILASQNHLQRIDFLSARVREKDPTSAVAVKVVKQLRQYFENPMFEFSIACQMDGSAYQQRVWSRLKSINSGRCMTYSAIADELSSGARAVGGACRANPVPIIVPCHRVVSKSGVGGYDGDWGAGKVKIKAWLLRHEGMI